MIKGVLQNSGLSYFKSPGLQACGEYETVAFKYQYQQLRAPDNRWQMPGC